MFKFSGVLLFFVICIFGSEAYQIGLGRGDVTGPSVEIPFMGYASLDQKGTGIHTRQFARTFIVQDSSGKRMVFSSVDAGMISHPVKRDVVAELQKRYGTMYRVDNVMLSATHTHSTPGGYHMYVLYDFTIYGFIADTYNALVQGITRSIVNAHENMVQGRIFISESEVHDVGVNRSPLAFENNPAAEKAEQEGNTDKRVVQLRFMDQNNNQILGAFTWVAVHPTSMNNTNTLVSSDNVGYASMLLEQDFNGDALVGKGSFVGAICSSSGADVSPNIMGPKCIKTGLPCHALESSCPDGDVCIASGPGSDHVESTKIIGTRIYVSASWLLRNRGGTEITGSISSIHQFVDMPKQTGNYLNPKTHQLEPFRGCLPAMGYSFAAGTTDGPGAFDFTQGSTSSNPFWNAVTDFLAEPTEDDAACHSPKPILLMTGRSVFPYLWQPDIIPTQIITLGDIAFTALPGEFTTMSGRRMRSELKKIGRENGRNLEVILAGHANIYSSYVVTPEEYQIQRYEGASTIFGPHTLTIYIQQHQKLMSALLKGQSVDSGPQPVDQDSKQISLMTGIIYDDATGTSFGNVITQPRATYNRGNTVISTFVSGNPRNNVMAESSFFFVDRLNSGGWETIATDANWETKFIWRRTSQLLGRSEIDFYWEIPSSATTGQYRIRHSGYYKTLILGTRTYSGTTQTFNIA